MCIIGTVGDVVVVRVSTMAPVVPVASSSSSALVQIMKPKLPRRITRTAKINLNKYWNLFESIMTENVNGEPEPEPRLTANEFEDTDMNNEINENLSNEQKEMSEILVRRNNERNSIQNQRCTCHFCLISDLRNVTVSERSEEVTEL